nr:hypothetical protein BaRGS_010606 [Batillaria attramentaria]
MRYAAVLAMTRPLAKREKNKMVSPHDEMQGVIVAIDLQEKKIVASIRTGDLKVKDESLGPDELKVKSLVLSSDGSRLVCATYDSDELYFLDVTTLETKQKHKGI